jgi:hypothetical protein
MANSAPRRPSLSRARERRDVGAGDGELGAGVTVLELLMRAGRRWQRVSSNRGASPSVKAPRSEAVVDSPSGNTRVCGSVMREDHRGAGDDHQHGRGKALQDKERDTRSCLPCPLHAHRMN